MALADRHLHSRLLFMPPTSIALHPCDEQEFKFLTCRPLYGRTANLLSQHLHFGRNSSYINALYDIRISVEHFEIDIGG